MPQINLSGSPTVPPLYLAIYLGVFIVSLFVVFIVKRNVRAILFSTLVLLAATGGFLLYLMIPLPRILNTNPILGAEKVGIKTQIAIQFDHPVSRRIMEKTIMPDVAGMWVFEDPVYTTHLYRKVVFYPSDGFDPNTTYTVKISNIENTIQKSKSYDYQFSFTTEKTATLVTATPKPNAVKLQVPAYLQQHTLSCEVASLRMALAYKGISKTEDELLSQVGIDNTPHVGGTWGNPYEHFVGNVDGNQLRDGYGVYWGPIERVAKIYGNALAFENGNITTITKNIIAGNPVIIWVYSESGAPYHWTTPNGVNVFAVAGEHTVVVVGFVGPSDNPTQIIVNDSLTGQSYWTRGLFDHKWDTFSRSGVVIYK